MDSERRRGQPVRLGAVVSRILALVVLLLAGSADPAGFGRGGGLTTCPKGYIGGGLVPCTLPRAYFEFAPPDGAGMDGFCGCASVTGAKGEVIALTRASIGSCLKSTTSAVASGDMVICSANKPRVMPGPDSLAALLVEPMRTNYVPRSQEIDDASYSDFAVGAAAPVLNGADVVPAPDGTVTAEDYTFNATGALQASARSIAVLTAVAYSAQVWVRGAGGSGSMDLCLQIDATPTATCSTCTFVTTAWTQCSVEKVTSMAGGNVYVGNLSYFNGGIARASNRVYVWGLDAQRGNHITTYIPTAGSVVTRSGDIVTTTFATAVPTVGSFGISYTPQHGGAATLSCGAECGGPWVFSGLFRPLYAAALVNATIYDTVHTANAALTWVRGTKKSYCSSWSETNGQRVRSISDSTIGTSAFTAATYGGSTSLCLSGCSGGFSSGLISSICLDPDERRCCP